MTRAPCYVNRVEGTFFRREKPGWEELKCIPCILYKGRERRKRKKKKKKEDRARKHREREIDVVVSGWSWRDKDEMVEENLEGRHVIMRGMTLKTEE